MGVFAFALDALCDSHSPQGGRKNSEYGILSPIARSEKETGFLFHHLLGLSVVARIAIRFVVNYDYE